MTELRAVVRVAVVIPSFKVIKHILDVIQQIGPEIDRIYVVDDCCPERSGRWVEENCEDGRVIVLRNEENLGVGGAVMRGYQSAVRDGMDIIVKIDGDGQMNPSFIPDFIGPIVNGEADYTKGNRFFNLDEIQSMPKARIFGNAVLSFMTKLSTGYWNLFDPTNGYTAIHADIVRHLPLSKISRRYFFETDILFRLNILHAVVVDVPMDAQYSDEVSNLKISKIISEFLFNHARNFCKRIFYNYYLRDMSLASLELVLSIPLIFFGMGYGAYHWLESIRTTIPSGAGTVMLSALPIIMGIQLLLGFLSYDISSVPSRPLHRKAKIITRKIMETFNCN